MKTCVFLFSLLAFCPGCLFGNYPNYPTAKITVRVVDEKNTPVTNSTAYVMWSKLKTANNPWDGTTGILEEGAVDKNGEFTKAGKTLHKPGIGASCSGYYKSSDVFSFYRSSLGKWQPWDTTVTLRLRPIVNPIPMFLGEKWNTISKHPEFSFDFLKQDFLPPHGKGEIADCIFKLKREQEGQIDTLGFCQIETITTEFPGKFNGIEPIKSEDMIPESTFSTPRHAYDKTYSKTIITRKSGYRLHENTTSNHPKFSKERITENDPEEDMFFFRIRSETNPDGTFKSGLYGMMKVPIFQIMPSRVAKPSGYEVSGIKYQINMTPNDRNMEMDERWNLRPGSINFYDPSKVKNAK